LKAGRAGIGTNRSVGERPGDGRGSASRVLTLSTGDVYKGRVTRKQKERRDTLGPSKLKGGAGKDATARLITSKTPGGGRYRGRIADILAVEGDSARGHTRGIVLGSVVCTEGMQGGGAKGVAGSQWYDIGGAGRQVAQRWSRSTLRQQRRTSTHDWGWGAGGEKQNEVSGVQSLTRRRQRKKEGCTANKNQYCRKCCQSWAARRAAVIPKTSRSVAQVP